MEEKKLENLSGRNLSPALSANNSNFITGTKNYIYDFLETRPGLVKRAFGPTISETESQTANGSFKGWGKLARRTCDRRFVFLVTVYNLVYLFLR